MYIISKLHSIFTIYKYYFCTLKIDKCTDNIFLNNNLFLTCYL